MQTRNCCVHSQGLIARLHKTFESTKPNAFFFFFLQFQEVIWLGYTLSGIWKLLKNYIAFFRKIFCRHLWLTCHLSCTQAKVQFLENQVFGIWIINSAVGVGVVMFWINNPPCHAIDDGDVTASMTSFCMGLGWASCQQRIDDYNSDICCTRDLARAKSCKSR